MLRIATALVLEFLHVTNRPVKIAFWVAALLYASWEMASPVLDFMDKWEEIGQ